MNVSKIREQKTVRIDSMLFHILHERGGYNLVAVYCELKAFRNRPEKYVPITHSNNKKSSGYRLLQKCTSISIPTLKKNVPLIIEMGLGEFDFSGGFLMKGNRKTRLSTSGKLVPIKIGKSYTDTRLSAKFVVLSSNLRRQKILWKRKETLSELFKVKKSNNGFLSKRDMTLLDQACSRGESLGNMQMVKNSILSNKRIHELVSNRVSTNDLSSKSCGKYIKKKFREKGWIETRRRFRDILNRYVPIDEYLRMKLSIRRAGEIVTWRKGRVVKEICNEINDISEKINLSVCSQTLR